MIHNVEIESRPQDNKDVRSTCVKARYRWVTQLLVLFDKDPELSVFLHKDGSVPNCLGMEKLTLIHRAGIAWWDEVHIECFIGNFREGKKNAN